MKLCFFLYSLILCFSLNLLSSESIKKDKKEFRVSFDQVVQVYHKADDGMCEKCADIDLRDREREELQLFPFSIPQAKTESYYCDYSAYNMALKISLTSDLFAKCYASRKKKGNSLKFEQKEIVHEKDNDF